MAGFQFHSWFVGVCSVTVVSSSSISARVEGVVWSLLKLHHCSCKVLNVDKVTPPGMVGRLAVSLSSKLSSSLRSDWGPLLGISMLKTDTGKEEHKANESTMSTRIVILKTHTF